MSLSVVGISEVKPALLNASNDELWTDTDDESFIRATQTVLDTAGDCFTSPMAVTRPMAITSTPNVKSSRCRRTFCLDPVPPCPLNIQPSRAGTALAGCSVAPVSSPLRDVSLTDELLATLAEPDDVLDSQIQLTDAAAGAVDREKQSSGSHTASERHGARAGNTMAGMYYAVKYSSVNS